MHLPAPLTCTLMRRTISPCCYRLYAPLTMFIQCRQCITYHETMSYDRFAPGHMQEVHVTQSCRHANSLQEHHIDTFLHVPLQVVRPLVRTARRAAASGLPACDSIAFGSAVEQRPRRRAARRWAMSPARAAAPACCACPRYRAAGRAGAALRTLLSGSMSNTGLPHDALRQSGIVPHDESESPARSRVAHAHATNHRGTGDIHPSATLAIRPDVPTPS